MLPHISVSSSKTSPRWADFHVSPQGSCSGVWEATEAPGFLWRSVWPLIQPALLLPTSVSLAVSPVLAVTSGGLGRNARPGEVILLHKEQDLAPSACQAAAPVCLTRTCAGPALLSNPRPAAAPPLPTPELLPPTPGAPSFQHRHLLALWPWRQGCSAINTSPLPSPGQRAAWLGLPTACR